jgi:sugar lactone lactonase YvrE
MIIKFDPEGRVVMTFGRKPEAVTIPYTAPVPASNGVVPFEGRGIGAGVLGDNFDQPTDVAWDASENIFISDGHGNSRIAKFDKNGKFIKTWGNKGSGPGQFDDPHSIAIDAKGNLYVGDRENHRIQIFDNDGNFKYQIANVGARPNAICVSPGPHQYLYSSNTNTEDMKNGEIYKMELDGTMVGKFGKAGRQLKEFNGVAQIDCRSENELYVAENMNWRVQKLTLHPTR